MRNSIAAIALLVLALLAFSACGKTEPGGTSPSATAPASPTDSAQPGSGVSATASPVAGPAWVRALPPRPVTAKVGDIVWATVPKAEEDMIEEFGPCAVTAVAGDKATLKGDMDKVCPDVPGSVILPPEPLPAVKVGDIVTLGVHGMPKVGVVKALKDGKVKVKYAWAGSASEGDFDQFRPLVAGVAPLAWVLYQGEGMVTSKYKGIVIAMDGGKVWVLSGSGHIVMKAAAEVWPLPLTRTYTVGQKVFANYPCYVEGTVKKVLEPNLRYQVEIKASSGKPEVKEYFYDDLVVSLP